MSKTQKKYSFLIIAGEESGDIHGAKLVHELKILNPSIKFIGHGGDKMKAAGVEIVEHISKLALVGLTEVIKRLPYFNRVMKDTVRLIEKSKPSRIILIDYPGFNLRLAKRVQKLNIPITYFILPQAWAWKENRANQIKDNIDQSLSIIPFEKEWYGKRGVEIEFVGHPFTELEVPGVKKSEFFAKHQIDTNYPLLVLLPGSRQQEIDRHWPIFIDVVNHLKLTFPNIQFILGKAPNIIIPQCPEIIKIEDTDLGATMRYGTAGLIASGTATLEAAVLGLPAVVCYKTSKITYLIGKRLTKVQYLSLINLIAKKKIVPEFIQDNMTSEKLIKTVIPLLADTPEREKMLYGYNQVNTELGEKGVYQRTAKLIIDKLFNQYINE